jgi:hypothetical protein
MLRENYESIGTRFRGVNALLASVDGCHALTPRKTFSQKNRLERGGWACSPRIDNTPPNMPTRRPLLVPVAKLSMRREGMAPALLLWL